MSSVPSSLNPNDAGGHGDSHDHEHHDTGGNTVFGFWLYLMTDCLLFASFFATYAVLYMNTAGGVSGKDIFELDFVAVETAALLLSSITFGFAMIAAHAQKKALTLTWLGVTFAFGAVFIGMEIYEFHHLIVNGNGPQESAFLTAFFSLVGLHGAHVTAGLIWMTIMIIEVARRGLGSHTVTRLSCLSLFWHFLDIVWICVFTVVYLIGAM
ncbi:cytochrome o ubiquinol oxidase subunit III [Salinimonas sediminis]|uniref:Cytochrome bo(3) ubiquinol oxidase subunit 3 n=1 Tax=Salinimonas sediminis TaxID=2303538 RepID=A0A346NQ72_9ALTE|nr:cytochrome o ubiquinol oxidase subunit III [Salinimonas sediminis]AXR07679.1 cytochrome o ubiquinol oxidase subunit III [Salinimonas sediminis]